MRLFTLVASFITATAVNASSPEADPFREIQRISYPNGLQVYLAPSSDATLTAIKVAVDTGFGAEDKNNWGVAHLLEHVLFRDKELKDEMSYLQLIKEAGGNANGSTSDYETNYYGSIPAHKGEWLLQQFTRLILNPEIRPEYVTKEKSTVEIERGRPGALTQLLGYDPRDILNPRYLNMPTFLESEFDIHSEEKFTLAQEQLSTQRLTQKQVQDFYNDYYCPSNMHLFVTGKFDQTAILKFIETNWATLPRRECKVLPPLPQPKPRAEPYTKVRVTEDTPWVQIGTKVWDTASRDASVIDSYMEFLAHRMMKDMRNKRGQAYSINAQTSIVRRYGYSILEFHTQKENLNSNLEMVRGLLKAEATDGGLTTEQIKEAKDLYLAAYQLSGKEAWEMMGMAERVRSEYRDYGRFDSPYLQLVDVSPEEYQGILKTYFQPKQSYLSLRRPSLLFPYDGMVFALIIAASTFIVLKKVLTKPFAHDQIRWVRKIKFPPVKLLEVLVLVGAWYVFAHVNFAVSMALASISALQAHVFTAEYLQTAISIVTGLIVVQGFLSIVPRKLMIVGDSLVIKSLSYYSHSIPLQQIQSIETRRALSYPFPVELWWKRVGPRFYFFNPRFWQKGTLVHLKDGRSYFFGIRSFPQIHLDQN